MRYLAYKYKAKGDRNTRKNFLAEKNKTLRKVKGKKIYLHIEYFSDGQYTMNGRIYYREEGDAFTNFIDNQQIKSFYNYIKRTKSRYYVHYVSVLISTKIKDSIDTNSDWFFGPQKENHRIVLWNK